MIDMEQAEPHVPVVDIWPHGLTDLQKVAYRLCIDAGLIVVQVVKADPLTQYTIVQYLSTIPEEWIHDTLKACFEENYERFLLVSEKREQLKMTGV